MKRIGLYFTWLLILLMAFLPLYPLREGLSVGKTPPEINRLHWQTNNTTRIWGDDWKQLQEQVINIRVRANPALPRYVAVVDPNSWQEALAACSLISSPVNAFIILADNGAIPQMLQNLITSNSRRASTPTDLLLIGKVTRFETAFRRQGYRTTSIPASDFAATARQIDLELSKTSGLSREVFLINGAASPALALPAAVWAAHRGTPVLFFNGNNLPDITKTALRTRRGNCRIYIMAPPGSTNRNLKKELAALGKITEIGDMDPAQNSVVFARFFDKSTGLGWQTTNKNTDGGKQFLLAPGGDWRMGIVGVQLFNGGIFGPILVSMDKTRLPLALEKFYFTTKPDWWVTPAEGPYNHTWILGNTEQISYSQQGRVNFLEEISDYQSKGSQGISGLESITLIWYVLSIVCALLAWAHLSTRMFQLSPFMRLGWILLMLALGPIGLWAYYISYRGYGHQTAKGDFLRPRWVEVLAATCSTLGFGMPVMILTAFAMTYWGLPLILNRGPLFIFTGPMFQSILWSYVAAILVNSLLFVPLMLAFKENSTYWDTVKDNFITVFWSMTSISAGMMPVMWWIMMKYLPMMPREENLLWWGSMYASSLAGLLTGYIGNWPLVIGGRKKGTM